MFFWSACSTRTVKCLQHISKIYFLWIIFQRYTPIWKSFVGVCKISSVQLILQSSVSFSAFSLIFLLRVFFSASVKHFDQHWTAAAAVAKHATKVWHSAVRLSAHAHAHVNAILSSCVCYFIGQFTKHKSNGKIVAFCTIMSNVAIYKILYVFCVCVLYLSFSSSSLLKKNADF